jgi:hypothetical protein
MKLGNKVFFNLFSRLVAATNTDRDRDEWQVNGVHWRRQRHSLWAPTSFQIELHELRHTARPAWTLIFVRETWWVTDRTRAIRDACWTHLEKGSRSDVLRWFAEREVELDRKSQGAEFPRP